MSAESMKKHARPDTDLTPEERAELESLAALSDDEVERRAADDPDALPASPDWLAEGELVEPKVPVHIRLDREVVDYFKAGGKGYQSRINAVLRHYVRAQERETGPRS